MTADVLDVTNVRRRKSYAQNIASADPLPDPLTTTRIIVGPRTGMVRVWIDFSGTVTQCSVRMWLLSNSGWYQGASTDENDPLVAGVASQVRDFYGVQSSIIGFQVETLVGGGTVSIDFEVARTE